MMEQMKDTITSFGENVLGTVSSPSEQHFLTVNEEAEEIPDYMRDIFIQIWKIYCILLKGHGLTLK